MLNMLFSIHYYMRISLKDDKKRVVCNRQPMTTLLDFCICRKPSGHLGANMFCPTFTALLEKKIIV